MKLFFLIATLLLQAPAPTGTVNGRVTVTGTGQPIAEAEIAVAAAGTVLETMTDANGRFSLVNVPTGRQTLIIRADGFFAAPAAAGAIPRQSAEAPVTVAQQAASVSVEMVRGAIITGKVVDPQGLPMISARVEALRDQQSVASRVTDDQGEYRMFWVPPGEYLIGVTPRPAPANLAAPPPPGGFPRIARTLFPGTTDAAQATKVVVKSGEEIRGIDISARMDVLIPPPAPRPAPPASPVPTQGVKVSGQITNALMPATGQAVLLLGAETESVPPRQVGQVNLNAATVPFEIPSVPPGKHDLFVRMVDPRGSQGTGGATQAWGRTTIEVRDRDMDGVLMTIHPSFDVPGILKIDGKAVFAGSGLKVGLIPLGTAGRIANYRGITNRDQLPGAEGKFSIPKAAAGDYELVVGGLTATAYIADIRQGDASVLPDGVRVRDVPPATVEVLIATDGGTVEGIATNRDKSPAGAVAVLLVPDDRQLMRLAKQTTTSPDGRYSIRGIRPGEYKLFVTPGGLPVTAFPPEVLSSYEAKGIKVTVKAATTTMADAGLITD